MTENTWESLARMRILRASQALESQKTLGNRSENANFEGQPRATMTENTWESQRNMRILRASQTLESQKTLGNRSENANFEGQPSA